MNPATDVILAHLKTVADERARRRSDPELQQRVDGLKRWQQQRFSQTYADLLASARYGTAARFFLDELYGAADFTHRDDQFARVVPIMVRTVPTEVVKTVTALSELHALTEQLDTRMAMNASTSTWSAAEYRQAWQKTGQPENREKQLVSALQLAHRLDALTRSRLLRNTLRLMRGPARMRGLQDLQRFLEAGFDAFGAMGGADDFMRVIAERERAFMASQFDGSPTGH